MAYIKSAELDTLTKRTLAEAVAAGFFEVHPEITTTLKLLKTSNSPTKTSKHSPQTIIRQVIETIAEVARFTLLHGGAVRLQKIGSLTPIRNAGRRGVRDIQSTEIRALPPFNSATLKSSRYQNVKFELSHSGMVSLLEEIHPVRTQYIKEIYRLFLDKISEIQKGKTELEIRGLGRFSPSLLAAREVRNPKSGLTHSVSENVVIRFRCSKSLKDLLNDKGDGLFDNSVNSLDELLFLYQNYLAYKNQPERSEEETHAILHATLSKINNGECQFITNDEARARMSEKLRELAQA